MAQSIVSTVVGKLGELLIKEVNFLQGVAEELTSLQSEFQWFQAFLKDADATIQGGNERAKTWVNQVRDVAYDAEDIIDTYIFKIHQHRRGSHGCLFSSLMTTYACHPSRLTILHDLGNEIVKVKRRAEEISANRSKYGIDSVGATTSSCSLTSNETRLPLSWKQTPVVEEVDVVGFDDVKKLVQLLLVEDEGTQDTQRRRPVISIVGMGGLGKTTLAKKVFSNPTIKQHFACHAWVYVSQAYTDRELVESIAKQLMVVDEVRMNKLKDDELKKMVYEHLKERKYLVVTDDVWTRRAWDNIKEVLPAEMLNGSKVLLTTRNREVALHADRQIPPFDLKLLGEEESWELFCKKAIPTKCSKHCPPKLETIGRQMVEKCGGLPLAIVVLGGLAMRKEQSEEEWRKLLKSVSWQLREGEDQISKILSLSYHNLPYYMKPCFLYFAMFPEDSLIDAEDLMLKWIAEGFIEARGEETMEEVAEEYLEELVHRSLIQVVVRNLWGVITACRIHDLLLDLAISEAKGTNFLLVTETNNNNNNNEGSIITLQKTRRLALHGDESWDIGQQYPTDSTRSLRTVTLFGSDVWRSNLVSLCDKFLTAIVRHFVLGGVLYDYVDHNHPGLFMSFQIPQILISMKLIRVIDLRNLEIIVPDAIGELIHLRYLNVRVVRSKPLPSSIGELTNLQTLEFGNKYSNIELPSEIWKSNLRHLKCVRWSFSIKGQPSVNSLSNLRTLSSIEAGKWLYKGLDKMTNLRNLSIGDINNSHGKPLIDFLGKLNNLIELKLMAKYPSYEHQIPTSILTASHHKHLRCVYLKAKLERLPDVNTQCLLTNLIKLILSNSFLVEDPLVTLGKLDNLQVLELYNDAFVGKEMVCLEKGFPQLKVLVFLNLESLEEWKIDDVAMPRLRKLVIWNCEKLVMLPHGLGRITSLQELEVRYMPVAFSQRLKENDGEDWDKVRHVPSVNIH
ncbi:LOW QUALITY PROTEIN: putative disease resistance protein At1g50180 [Dioscorea cayenensis subsp. rotundata]|uniref:LOW QUALITY PROTEIN: putative disease resistance protein At1g50180 n=1 Tax=Dioscorea cayennensis subsp. rotundata TaxID=55577 RepID=A0AB40CIM4_DIOCR|nr:LOW QUALITY PROTEIN: putative disease resistance protein At1g50180 [Dioscorea cayenensis subsp. rotundata]